MKHKTYDSDSEETEPAGSVASAPAEKKCKTDGGAVASGTRRTTRSQIPCLSTETIAKVSSFANHGDDLMNICVATGVKDSNVVRQVCLRNNLNYICWVLEGRIKKKNATAFFRRRNQVHVWMNINHDWRRYCSKEKVSHPMYSNASSRSSESLVLFNNPVVAIEFGLVSILKHLVEVIGIDVNCYKWCSYAFPGRKQHLVASAAIMSTVDSACFEYFLTRSDVDFDATHFNTDPARTLCVWTCAFVNASEEVFQTMLQHPGFNVNGHDSLDRHYLWLAVSCCHSLASGEVQKLRIGNLKRLLDAGADPELDALERVRRYLQRAGEDSDEGKIWKRLIEIMEDAVAARNEGNYV